MSIADINATPVNNLKSGRYASSPLTAVMLSALNATDAHLEEGLQGHSREVI